MKMDPRDMSTYQGDVSSLPYHANVDRYHKERIAYAAGLIQATECEIYTPIREIVDIRPV